MSIRWLNENVSKCKELLDLVPSSFNPCTWETEASLWVLGQPGLHVRTCPAPPPLIKTLNHFECSGLIQMLRLDSSGSIFLFKCLCVLRQGLLHTPKCKCEKKSPFTCVKVQKYHNYVPTALTFPERKLLSPVVTASLRDVNTCQAFKSPPKHALYSVWFAGSVKNWVRQVPSFLPL